MELTREAPEGTLDVVGARATRHSEELVVITLGRRHLRRSVATGSVVLVDLFHEARQLLRRTAHGPDCLVVVHAIVAKETDGAECPIRESIGRADERGALEAWIGELAADPNKRVPRIEHIPKDLKQRSTPLERDEHTPVRSELVLGDVVEQTGGAT